MKRQLILLLARFGAYTRKPTRDGKYGYITGPMLPNPSYVVIRKELLDEPERWTKDWMSGEPAGRLWFSFWKLKMGEPHAATRTEVDWYLGFLEVDAHARRR